MTDQYAATGLTLKDIVGLPAPTSVEDDETSRLRKEVEELREQQREQQNHLVETNRCLVEVTHYLIQIQNAGRQ